MVIDRMKLEHFRDLKISLGELNQKLSNDMKRISLENPIEISNKHVINILEGYKNGSQTKENVLEWVNTIWFSGLFEYCDEQCDSIASVMNCLEEIDEEGNELTFKKIEMYLEALRQNVEVN